MRFANYGRKSIYSDHSDSIDNQFQMSKSYAELHFPGQIDCFLQYSDEDFTGANTKRPDLQRLINDVKNSMIDVLIVYQLDRLSRDIRDFSAMYSILEEHGVKFISVKENIDTTTPIGRAMMYVSVVFAQMERENTAERVMDNMRGLAKKGYWTGGNPPVGYKRKKVVIDGRKHVTIEPDPDGVKYVHWLFNTFLENRFSIQRMESYFKQRGIRTKTGAFFSSSQIYKLLTMPFCAEATKDVYDYYEKKGCMMESPRGAWDGSTGVMIYGRTSERSGKHQLQPPEKWIVCVGKHEPFMPAEKWLRVQSQLSRNKLDKKMKYDVPLLKGVLRCSCGCLMAVSRKKNKQSVSSWYHCPKRMRQGVEACDAKQIKIEILDNKVLEIFSRISQDPSLVHNYVKKHVAPVSHGDPAEINKKINACKTRIGRLTESLSESSGSSAARYIVTEIERIDLEIQVLSREYAAAIMAQKKSKQEVKSSEDIVSEISDFIANFDNFTAKERNDIVKDVIKECVWDGTTLSVVI